MKHKASKALRNCGAPGMQDWQALERELKILAIFMLNLEWIWEEGCWPAT
jgi:hypothetical protein